MQPSSSRRPHGLAFVVHSLTPTLMTVVGYFLLSVVFIGTHFLVLTANGAAKPASIDQQILEQYQHYVIGPVITLMNNNLVNSITTLILWGLAGLLICTAVASATRRLNEWRIAEQNITVPTYGVVVHHPLRRTLFIRFMWQFFVAVLIALLTALILPVVKFCLSSDVRALQSASIASGIYISAITAIIWMLVLHAYVVLFRLYLLRTRVFGEILD